MLGLFQWIEAALNRALEFDARTPQRLESLQGKKLGVEMRDLKLKVGIHFVKEGLHFSHACSPLDPTDVTVKGPIAAFLSLAFSKDPFAASRLGLSIEGDIQVAEKMQIFFLDLQLDWEEILAQCTGDTVAHSLFTLFKKGQQQQKRIQKNLTLALGDYLKQETRLLPHPIEVDEFLDGVDELTQAIDRLQAHLVLLERGKAEGKEDKGNEQAKRETLK